MITKVEAKAYQAHLLAFLKRLSHDRSQLKHEAMMGEEGEASGGLSNVPIEPVDIATHGFEEEVTLGLLENEEKLIEEINLALDRIDTGAFGRCEACGKGIGRERLKSIAYARHCVTCARKFQGST